MSDSLKGKVAIASVKDVLVQTEVKLVVPSNAPTVKL